MSLYALFYAYIICIFPRELYSIPEIIRIVYPIVLYITGM